VKWQVSIRAEARTDLRVAYDWYEDRCPGLGDEFIVSIAEVLIRLEQNPEAFPFYHRDFRRALTRRFPYKVFFQIRGNAVIVFRVLHGAQEHKRQFKA
jgi:plasmid stabilization system protein ParE